MERMNATVRKHPELTFYNEKELIILIEPQLLDHGASFHSAQGKEFLRRRVTLLCRCVPVLTLIFIHYICFPPVSY